MGKEGAAKLVTSWEASVLSVRKRFLFMMQSVLCHSGGLAAAFFHKAKALSGHLQVFLTFPSTPCFFLSLFFLLHHHTPMRSKK